MAMNAYLPTLAKYSPEVISLSEELESGPSPTTVDASNEESTDETVQEPLLPPSPLDEIALASKARYDTALSNAISRISSLGIALGYSAGILLLILALIPVTKLHGSTFSLRLAIGLSGIWCISKLVSCVMFRLKLMVCDRWAVFSIPAAIWLPGSVSITTRASELANDTGDGKWHIRREIAAAWKRLGGMLRWSEIRALRNTFKYLAAWFLLSDGQYRSFRTTERLDKT